jgi:hypothetical protein
MHAPFEEPLAVFFKEPQREVSKSHIFAKKASQGNCLRATRTEIFFSFFLLKTPGSIFKKPRAAQLQ